jgi:putative endonuclease
MSRLYFVYIVTNCRGGVLYVGMTNNLIARCRQHRSLKGSAFTSRYRLRRLVYFEAHPYALDAIEREKQLKAGSRKQKVTLIGKMNPKWRDLFDDINDNL